jgi:hypothetical protein
MVTRFNVLEEKNPRRISPARAFNFYTVRLLFFTAARAATFFAFAATLFRRRRCCRRSDQSYQAQNQ